jgi:hypothetical protein
LAAALADLVSCLRGSAEKAVVVMKTVESVAQALNTSVVLASGRKKTERPGPEGPAKPRSFRGLKPLAPSGMKPSAASGIFDLQLKDHSGFWPTAQSQPRLFSSKI